MHFCCWIEEVLLTRNDQSWFLAFFFGGEGGFWYLLIWKKWKEKGSLLFLKIRGLWLSILRNFWSLGFKFLVGSIC